MELSPALNCQPRPSRVSDCEPDDDDEQLSDDEDKAEPDERNDKYTLNERACEELTEIDEHTYASRACWDENRYAGEELPDTARVIIRWFGGAFVIFQKTSFYNFVHGKLDAYSGRHNKMDAEQFRSHIEELRNAVQQRGLDLRAQRIRTRDKIRDDYENKEKR
jgi:hypothetical protein